MVAAMLGLALVCVIGIVFDDRMLLGESVWVKPLKFSVAFALYGATLAWLLTLPHRGRTWTFWLGTAFAVTGIVDVGFIAIQAARGTFSHFNTAEDTFNSVGQMIFASGVPGLFFANLAIAGILIWQRTADRPLTMAIRAGLVFAVAGMALGYVMAAQGKQVVRDADGHDVELAARHTVGAIDGGPGLPITHWSTVGGDLRIPHFVGLHGLQVMLLVALAVTAASGRIAWLRTERSRAVLIGELAFGYAGLLAIVTWQALRGQALIHPDGITLAALAALVTATGFGVWTVRAVGMRD